MNMPPLLPGLLSITLVVGGAALAFQVLRSQRRLISERVTRIAPASEPVGAVAVEVETGLLRISSQGLRAGDMAVIARLSAHLGLGRKNVLAMFAVIRLLSAALLGATVLVVLRRLGGGGGTETLMGLVLGPLGVGLGWLAPPFIVRRLSKRRAVAVSAGLPEALELLVICVEAGLALEDGLDRVTVELYRTQPLLAEELELTSADLKILPDRDHAFANLASRVNTPSIRSVVTTLSQTLRYGTPMSAALRVAAAELRNDLLIQLEERANRLPTLMTVPMMLFIMPTIFLVVGGPAVLRLLDVFHH